MEKHSSSLHSGHTPSGRDSPPSGTRDAPSGRTPFGRGSPSAHGSPPSGARCLGLTKKGARCKNKPGKGKKYCHLHCPSEPMAGAGASPTLRTSPKGVTASPKCTSPKTIPGRCPGKYKHSYVLPPSPASPGKRSGITFAWERRLTPPKTVVDVRGTLVFWKGTKVVARFPVYTTRDVIDEAVDNFEMDDDTSFMMQMIDFDAMDAAPDTGSATSSTDEYGGWITWPAPGKTGDVLELDNEGKKKELPFTRADMLSLGQLLRQVSYPPPVSKCSLRSPPK